MRVLFPLMLLLGVLVLLASALASLALALVIPVVLFFSGLALVASLRAIRLGLELMKGGFATFGHALSFVGDVFHLVFIWPDLERELTDSAFPPLIARMPPAQFPEFHALQVEAARVMGVRPIDELWVSPDTALGIGTAKNDGRRVRYLVVGFELVRTLTPTQLRAALLHEFGHERGGDLWLGRWARRLILRLALAAHAFAWFNPARWAAEVSLLVVKFGYLPWSRAKEFAADRLAAQHAGPQALAECLRAVKREGPAIDLALGLVLSRIEERRVAPVSLGQAVRRVYAQLSPAERHRIGVRAEGDPLELGGRTHPTIAMRIAAVSKLPAVAPVALPAFDPARLEAFEAQLSRRWLQGVARPVPVEEFLGPAGSAQPVASRGHAEPAEVDAALAAAPAPEGPTLADEDAPLELDTGYDWRDRQGG